LSPLSTQELIEIALIYKDYEKEGFDHNNQTLKEYADNLCKHLGSDLEIKCNSDWSRGF
jgi:hypothetical protein